MALMHLQYCVNTSIILQWNNLIGRAAEEAREFLRRRQSTSYARVIPAQSLSLVSFGEQPDPFERSASELIFAKSQYVFVLCTYVFQLLGLGFQVIFQASHFAILSFSC